MLFGDWSFAPAAEAATKAVRDPSNFQWYLLPIFALVLCVYWHEFSQKNYRGIFCALGLYSIHWLYEIANAVIAHFSGYALWTVSAESSAFILLVGVGAELSLMFSVAGFSSKLLPEDKKIKILGINNRWFFGIAMALFCSVVEIFLAWTPAFIWVYPWWGAIPVWITTYIPFFVGAYLIFDLPLKKQIKLVGGMVCLNIILLLVLVPLGII